jgi:endonuclease-3
MPPDIDQLLTLLTFEYGEQYLKSCEDHMQQLVLTILSHRTTWQDEKRAYDAMWSRYGSWEAIASADTAALTLLLAPVRYPERKAPYIQQTLAHIHQRTGTYNIDFLQDMPTDEAMTWLLSLPGVGFKTASLLMLFCFHRPVMPVDTHVHRVSKRLGIIPAKASADSAYHLLAKLLPEEAAYLYRYHKLLFKHGQRVCVHERPRCALCVLNQVCPTASLYLVPCNS